MYVCGARSLDVAASGLLLRARVLTGLAFYLEAQLRKLYFQTAKVAGKICPYVVVDCLSFLEGSH